MDVWFELSEASKYIDISWKLVETIERTTVRLSRKSLIKCDSDNICTMSIYDIDRLSPYLFFAETEVCVQQAPLKIYRSKLALTISLCIKNDNGLGIENYVIDYTLNEDSKIVFQSELFQHKKYICYIIVKKIEYENDSATSTESFHNYCDEPSYQMLSNVKSVHLSVQIKDMSLPIDLVIKSNSLIYKNVFSLFFL